jgi:hypothetical protein
MRHVLAGLLILVAMVVILKKKTGKAEDANDSLLPEEATAPKIESVKTSNGEGTTVKASPQKENKAAVQNLSAEQAAVASPKSEPVLMAPEEFRKLSKKVLMTLPKTGALQKLSAEEVHHTPALIREAGQNLGQVAQALHDNPALAGEAASFYKACFLKTDLPVQVRALCLADHRNLRVRGGDRADWTEDERQVHPEIHRLASMVPVPQR